MKKKRILFILLMLLILGIIGHLAYRTFNADNVYARIASSEWIGRWQSEGIGDGGNLKLKFEQIGDNQYRTIWLAEHYGICKAAFDEPLKFVTRDDGLVEIQGSINLGIDNGGEFKFKGVIIGDKLNMKWSSSTDHGELKLKKKNKKQ